MVPSAIRSLAGALVFGIHEVLLADPEARAVAHSVLPKLRGWFVDAFVGPVDSHADDSLVELRNCPKENDLSVGERLARQGRRYAFAAY